MFLIVYVLNSLFTTNVLGSQVTQRAGREKERAATGNEAEDFSLECALRGSARDTAFSTNGDFVIGGIFSIHHYIEEVHHDYTTKPKPSKCTGRSVEKK